MPGSSLVKPGHDAESVAGLGDAAFKALADFVFGQVAANENDTAVARLIVAPRPLVVAIEDHVHALKDETLGIVLE